LKQRIPIPAETRRKLILFTRYECCLCDSKISGKQESAIHHVNGDPSDNREENLIPLCRNCHAKADRGDFSEDHLKQIREAKIQKLGIKQAYEKAEEPKVAFKALFGSKLANVVDLLSKRSYETQFEDSIDELLMLFKERIEKWDVPSVRFATKELFEKLYKLSEEDGFCELYVIYKDLFSYAYAQRRHLIDAMIQVFSFILFESWVPEYDIEKGEKAAKVMLRLGTDFLGRDLDISEACLTAIDNLASDMFEPEILSKEILFGAIAYQQTKRNRKLQSLIDQAVDWIKINDEYEWDGGGGIGTYLRDSIQYAAWEQEKYETNIERFTLDFLLPALEENIKKGVREYADFLEGLADEGDNDVTFAAELLAQMILAYEFLRPDIHNEIKNKVAEKKDLQIEKLFKRIVNSSNFLRRIYEGHGMITTVKELVRFLGKNVRTEHLDVGMEIYGPSFLHFRRKLNEKTKKAVQKIAEKYALSETGEYELTEEELTFLMEDFVKVAPNPNNVKQLVNFLKEIDKVAEIAEFSTGAGFRLRKRQELEM
jgi:hypothetical protein